MRAIRRLKTGTVSWTRMRKLKPFSRGFLASVDQSAKTLLIKNVPDRVTQHELKEVFEDAFQIRLVSKDEMSESCRIAYIEFKSQAEAERALEEKQGAEVDGLAIVLDHIEEKSRAKKIEIERTGLGESHEFLVYPHRYVLMHVDVLQFPFFLDERQPTAGPAALHLRPRASCRPPAPA
ncbi:uncharacterized protein LOC100894420 isoform X2 [Callithrix jacchus]